jgi:hypothetical protein
VAPTNKIAEDSHAAQISGNFYLDLRRAIKARAMKWGIPIQINEAEDGDRHMTFPSRGGYPRVEFLYQV